LSQDGSPDRSCGECTACCQTLAVYDLEKPMWTRCTHLCPNGQGCGIYEERPHTCRQFHCVWRRGGLIADEDQRPDRLGVMFDAYIDLMTGEERVWAFPLWPGAMRDPHAAATLAAVAAEKPQLMLCDRGSQWAYGSPPPGETVTLHAPDQP
jgi:hypothetical protein